jgi:hypothetical protein
MVGSVVKALDSNIFFFRYLHYYQRYHGHHSALKFANAQRAMAEVRMAG